MVFVKNLLKENFIGMKVSCLGSIGCVYLIVL